MVDGKLCGKNEELAGAWGTGELDFDFLIFPVLV